MPLLLASHCHLGEEGVPVALEMLGFVDQTQVAKAAPLVYRLLVLLLEALPTARHPAAVGIVFALKVLQHEGMLWLEDGCCGYGYVEQGQLVCPCKGKSRGVWLSVAEAKLLQLLIANRSLRFIKEVEIDEELIAKAKRVIREQLS